MLVPAAVGGQGLRFIVRPATANTSASATATYPSLSRRPQGPPAQPSDVTHTPPPYEYHSPQLPFGRGRPGVALGYGPAYAPTAAVAASTDGGAVAYPPLSPYGYPHEQRRRYDLQPRRFGDPRKWMTSAMLMQQEVHGAAAYK